MFAIFRSATLLGLLLLSDQAVLAALPAADQTAVYMNRTFGFSLDVPRVAGTKPGPQVFSSPEENGAASSIVVLLQPQQTTRAEYLSQGVAMLKHDGCSIKESKALQVGGHDAVLLDYTQPPTQTNSRHILVLAVVSPDVVYNVTCMATPENFKRHEAEFRKSLESFTLLDGAPPLTQPASGTTFTNPDGNYAVTLPAFDIPSKTTIPALFRSIEGDSEITNLTVTVDTLKTTRQESVDNLKSLLSPSDRDAKLSRSDLQVAGRDATILDWEQTSTTGKRTHFLALKVFTADHVFSVLWTATPEHFDEHRAQFLECVKTFRLDPK